MEQDYSKIADSICSTIAKVGKPLSADQRVGLTGSVAMWLLQRDQRIGKLESVLRYIGQGGNTVPRGTDYVKHLEDFARKALEL